MAGFGGSGGGLNLPLGDHIAQVRDWKKTTGKAFENKPPQPQYEWGIDVWDTPNNAWIARVIFTGTNFSDPTKPQDPKFISKLTRLVRACGLPLPQTAAEAASWDENSMIARRFGIRMQEDVEAPGGKVEPKFMTIGTPQPPTATVATVQAPAVAAPAAPAPPTAPPVVPAPVAAPPPPPAAPAQQAAPAPLGLPVDPFAAEVGAQPVAA